MLFELSIALRLRHDLSKVAAPTPRSGACETWYPWVPTDQAHGRPRQVGPAYWKTCRPVSGPIRPNWLPTRPPEDPPEDSPRRPNSTRLQDLAYKTRQDLGGLRLKQIDGIWQDYNVDFGLLVVTDQEFGNRPHPLANIRRTKRSPCNITSTNPQAIYTDNWT
jgi:hypothetical protein